MRSFSVSFFLIHGLHSRRYIMFGLGAMEILIILVIAFLLFGPKELPEIGKQVGKAVKGFKETTEDLRQSVEPEINMIQQEFKAVEQDFEASVKEVEEQVKGISESDSGTQGGNKLV